jgi:hypothetical protein
MEVIFLYFFSFIYSELLNEAKSERNAVERTMSRIRSECLYASEASQLESAAPNEIQCGLTISFAYFEHGECQVFHIASLNGVYLTPNSPHQFSTGNSSPVTSAFIWSGVNTVLRKTKL